jgi:organic radical activating enzyme
LTEISNYVTQQAPERQLTDRGVLYTGFACNANCVFCYYAQTKDKTWFPIGELRKKIITYRDLYRNKEVDITGGEPTIYPDIVELLKFCRAMGIKPTIITNGIATADKEYLEKLKDAGLAELLVSVQGIGNKMDELTKVPGHYEKAMLTLDNCKELEIPFRTNTVVNKSNYQDLPELGKILCEKCSNVVNFIIFNPYYEWSHDKDIDFQEKHSVMSPFISKAIDVVEGFGKECNVRYYPFCMLPERQRHNIMNWMQLSYDRNEWDFGSWYGWTDELRLDLLVESGTRNVFSTNRYDNLYNMFAVRIRRDLNYKPSTCYSCFAKDICDGLNKQYYRRYGQVELEPIRNLYETSDPLYYKLKGGCKECQEEKK